MPEVEGAYASASERAAPMPARPVRRRLAHLDTLRGLAVFGILTVNVWSFVFGFTALRYGVLDAAAGWADRAAVFLVAAFAEQKSYPIFAFLFGAGFALQTRAGQGAMVLRRSRFKRRMAWLLVFGLLHGTLIWFGDILSTYAVVGAWLVTAVGLRIRAVCQRLRWVVLVNAVLLVVLPLLALLGDVAPINLGETVIEVDKSHAIYTLDSWGEAMPQRLGDFGINLGNLFVFGPKIALLFLLGALAVRLGWLVHPDRHRGEWQWVRAIGLGLGLPLNLWTAWVSLRCAAEPFDPPPLMELAWITAELAGPLLAAGYVAALVLAAPRMRAWLDRLMAPAGRMALTLYLSQSIILVLLLQGPGLQLGAVLSHWQLLLLCGGVFTAQLAAAHLWLRYARQGPMEALWRYLVDRGARSIESRSS
jgi:uncharacterized protein